MCMISHLVTLMFQHPEVNEAVKDIVDNEESTFIHGYMSNAGYEDVRQTIAESLNRRFGTHFNHTNIVMTVGAAKAGLIQYSRHYLIRAKRL